MVGQRPRRASRSDLVLLYSVVGQPPPPLPLRATQPPPPPPPPLSALPAPAPGDELTQLLEKVALELQTQVQQIQQLHPAAAASSPAQQLGRLAEDVSLARNSRDGAAHIHLVKLVSLGRTPQGGGGRLAAFGSKKLFILGSLLVLD